jgi:hypothetical protein
MQVEIEVERRVEVEVERRERVREKADEDVDVDGRDGEECEEIWSGSRPCKNCLLTTLLRAPG